MKIELLVSVFALAVSHTFAQSLSPTVVNTAGGSGSTGAIQLDWSIGEVAVTTIGNGTNELTQGVLQPNEVLVNINIHAFLQGPYSGAGIMSDGLRVAGLIPTTEPYTSLGYTQVLGGGETCATSVLSTTGGNAIVDWVHLQLRDKTNNTLVLATRNALLQADGDIVDTDGFSPVSFKGKADNYFVSVQHRNHLSIVSAASIALTRTAVTVDFANGSTTAYGVFAQATISGTYLLWSGDVTGDGEIKYVGSNNDRDPILVQIGGSVPTNVATGYTITDVNLDGQVKYVGAQNDRDPILVNIGGSVPTNVRSEQMP